MIEGYSPVVQALLGTLFTWSLTFLGSAMVVLLECSSNEAFKRQILDTMLGFASGVMLAASYWSLLAPAIEHAEADPLYGPDGRWAFVPAAVGFAFGGVGMVVVDSLIKLTGSPIAAPLNMRKKDDDHDQERGTQASSAASDKAVAKNRSWHRILMLVIAITLHNFPEGLAVGVGFGALGKQQDAARAGAVAVEGDGSGQGPDASSAFAKARNLAIGIGLQNFPEGLAVSMPLRREGLSLWKSIWYGQLSGLVEPIGGLLGAWLVTVFDPILPYALSFAAGAMIYVVVNDLIPEAREGGNAKAATTGCMVGFIVMMTMDVGLG